MQSPPAALDRELALIYQVGQHITQLQSLSDLLPQLLAVISETFGYNSMGILLVDEERQEVAVCATIGLERERHLGFCLPITTEHRGGLVGHVAATGKPLLAADVRHAPNYVKTVEETRSELVVPLTIKGRVIGVIDVQSVVVGGLTEHDQLILTTLADQVAIAIENARLYEALSQAHAELSQTAEQVQRLLHRTLHVQEEERRRIAADVHDSVLQLLYGALYQTGAQLRAPEPAAPSLENMRQVHELINQSMAEMYKVIFDLWPTSLEALGLLAALRAYLRSFDEAAGLRSTLLIEGEPPAFSPWAEITIFRIVQEALHNVRKHAQARTVEIRVVNDAATVTLSVWDDGVGFEPERALGVEQPHVGLISMRERARSLGGEFQLESHPGGGTALRWRFARARLEVHDERQDPGVDRR